MDVKRFLFAGTTHIHTANPQGGFAKVAGIIVGSLALGSALATAAIFAALHSGLDVSAMPIDTDKASSFYQGLVAPESNADLKIISTKSANLNAMLGMIPDKLLKTIADPSMERGAILSRAGAEGNHEGMATSLTERTFFKQQSVCIVEAERVVENSVLTAGGYPYWSFDQAEKGDPVLAMTNFSVAEAKAIITLHELAHCKTNLALDLGDNKVTRDQQVQQTFDHAVKEMASDLAVVLYYASQEGSFENGRLAVGNIRNNLWGGGHVTQDMLDQVLSHLEPDHFKGMGTPELFDQVVQIVSEVHRVEAEQLYNAFMQETYENEYLRAVVSGDRAMAEHLSRPEIIRGVMDQYGADFSTDFQGRAHQKLNQIIENGLRNPELHKAIGDVTLAKLSGLALKLNTALEPGQIDKISRLDATFDNQAATGMSAHL